MRESVCFITEPLLSPEFVQYRLVAPIAGELSSTYDVAVASPAIAEEAADRLRSLHVEPLSGEAWFPRPRGPVDEASSFVVSWSRDALLGLNRRLIERLVSGREGVRVNFSMTNSIPSDVWYVQSRPLAESLDSILPNFRGPLRVAAAIARPVVGLVGNRHFETTLHGTRSLYANSRTLSEWFLRHGIRAAGSVPSFLELDSFHPPPGMATRDYILVYIGKETDVEAVEGLLQLGFPLKLFGGKSASWVSTTLGRALPRHVESLGFVTRDQLVGLYANALFTAFPFTEEPFGLVPVESMACGTPVLTYDAEGPGETVVNGATGWLVRTPAEFVREAAVLIRDGYPSEVPANCVERAGTYSLRRAAARWREIIGAALGSSHSTEAGRQPPREFASTPGTGAC